MTAMTFEEDSSNDNIFTNSDLNTRGDAERGLSFSVEYDNTVTTSIGFSTANIAINAGDEWSSGEEIGITLTDADANINTGDGDDLKVSNEDQMIPTITIGDPQTLTNGIRATLTSDDGINTLNNTSGATVKDADVSQRALISYDGTVDSPDSEGTLTIDLTGMSADDSETTFQVVNYDFSAFEDADIVVRHFTAAVTDDPNTDADEEAAEVIVAISNDHADTYIVTDAKPMPNQILLTFAAGDAIETGAVAFDIFTFGIESDLGDNVNDAIYRLELEEDGDNSSDFTGTLEYIGLNQINILEQSTYGDIDASGDSIVLISDDDSISVEYLDLDSTGGDTLFTAEADTPTHSGSVSLGSDGYRIADTVVITVEDADLNVDSGKADVYTVVYREAADAVDAVDADGNPVVDDVDTPDVDESIETPAVTTLNLNDRVGSSLDLVNSLNEDNLFGELLSVSFDGDLWTNKDSCIRQGFSSATGDYGLADTQFTLQETGSATGVFVGTFAVPAQHCTEGGDVESITGKDISVEYIDFRDDSGSIISVSASAGIRSNTGSVSLDRTVYPVPFGSEGTSTNNNSVFETHDDGKLGTGDLKVYIQINDPDFDQSSNGIDSIEMDADKAAPLSIEVIRGSDEYSLGYAGHNGEPIAETAPNSGIFEYELSISYGQGPPDANNCPSQIVDDDADNRTIEERNAEIRAQNAIAAAQYAIAFNSADTDGDGEIDGTEVAPDELELTKEISLISPGCILQGDILHVQYTDPSDASGSSNTVTDSATFDLRNGVLQVDKPGTTGYVIGSDMIVTLIEQDLNLDSDATETYSLDLIEWDSDAGTKTLNYGDFGATPSNLLETGTDTGIFQVVITVPDVIDDSPLERGEEITLTYNDWGPSGSDHVGDKDEEITATAYTSNFGASIELDQKVYTWTDKVYITIVAPDHNFDSDQVDEIGGPNTNYPINIKTQEADIEDYKLVETGADTGIFSGELILIGVENDDLDKEAEESGGTGPTDGRLAAEDSDGLAIIFENSDGDIVRASAIIQWNVGEVEWLEASYPALGSGIVRVIDPDMNLNPEAVDNFDVNVWSDSDVGGISLTVTETNAATGIFEGTVFFDDDSISSGHRLNVEEGDTVVAEYDDVTSPIEDETSVSATTLIGTIVPPLERAPITNLRAVDTFDNSIGSLSVGQQVVISSDLTNGQDRDQKFIFLIQVQDENGVTVSLNWVQGTLAANQSFSPGASWTPTDAGTYDVTAFVWESIDNPTALSPTATIALTVN